MYNENTEDKKNNITNEEDISKNGKRIIWRSKN